MLTVSLRRLHQTFKSNTEKNSEENPPALFLKHLTERIEYFVGILDKSTAIEEPESSPINPYQ